MTDYAAHSVEHGLCVCRRVHMAVIVIMGSVSVDMRMCVFMSVLIYMSVLMKMLMCMNVTVIVIV